MIFENIVPIFDGELRIKKGFALFPKRVNRTTEVWLGKYIITEIGLEVKNYDMDSEDQFAWRLYDKQTNTWRGKSTGKWYDYKGVIKEEELKKTEKPPIPIKQTNRLDGVE